VLLALTLLGESSFVLVQSEPASETFYLGVLTSSPFIIGLIYGGYWLGEMGLEADQYGRIAKWWAIGILVAVTIIFVINNSIRPITLKMVVETVRWSTALGGGVGLLLGVFQAQAIQQAIKAERARLRQQELQRNLKNAQLAGMFRRLISPSLGAKNQFDVSDGARQHQFTKLTVPSSSSNHLAVSAAKREKRRFDV
jgi:hypothetical protein